MGKTSSVTTPDQLFALTLTQKDIYFDQLRNPDSPLYNVGGYVRIGQVDVARLQQAHQSLVQDEAAFGIRILSTSQGVEQSISEDRNTALTVMDFSADEDAQSSATAWLTQLFETPLDIDNRELFKAILLKISPTAYWYIGYAHHLMMDGWGFANWAQRLEQVYNDHQPTKQPSLQSPQQACQSAEAWQTIAHKDEHYVQSKKYQSDRDYWLQQPLTTDRLLTPHYQLPAQGPTSRRTILPLSNRQFAAVGAFAQRHEVGISHVFLAMLASYFSTTYSQSELVFGLPFHNRRNHQQKQMLGVFTSISPLAVQVADETSFVQLAKQIARQQKNNFRHQRYPIGHMLNDLQRTGEDQSLYDICFNYLKLDSQLSFEGQAADLVYLSHHHETTPLMVTVWEHSEENEEGEQRDAKIKIDYNFAYFDEQEISQLSARFSHHLEQLLTQAEQPLKRVESIPKQELDYLLHTMNDNAKAYANGKLIHQLFVEQAAKTPDNIALEFVDADSGRQQLTYRALDQRSNQLARYLHNQGLLDQGLLEASADTLVGIAMHRSLAMVIGVLAILKAGGAYVPLDPKYPQGRLDGILADSQIKLLLTDTQLVSRFTSDSQQRRVIAPFADASTGELMAELVNTSGAPLVADSSQSPEDLAYVIYTSGSTGLPKGVAVRHRNTVAMLHWAKAHYAQDELSRVLASTSLNFDLSVFELFAPLCFGHQCVMIDNPLTLLEMSIEVSLINTVPSAINVLMANNAVPSGVKVINLAGEPLAAQTVNTLLEKGFCTKVCNLYGPSEDTTYSTCGQFLTPITGTPDIGKVISNSQAYVLSAQQELLPTGVVGELYLAGAGVARGYLKQDALTQERFVANPFGAGKLYRTGDLVRYLPDGALAFLGRTDDQVKIRGFRIELGEIEYQLATHASVVNCVVLAKDNFAGEPQLVAYVVLADTECATTEPLLAHLKQLLPAYMVPSAFVVMDEIPLTANGKVNKKALPVPDQLVLKSQYVAPSTDTEQQLVLIWSELLHLPAQALSISTSFFEMGGHSLSSVQLIGMIRDTLQVQISVKDVFERPTIQALALQVDQLASQPPTELMPAIVKADKVTKPDHGGLPLSFAQQSLWFIDQLQGGSVHYNMPIAFEVIGPFNTQLAEQALLRIISRHQVLHTVYRRDGVDVVQVKKSSIDFTLPVVDLSSLDGDAQSLEVQRRVNEHATRAFDLSEDILLRANWLQLDQTAGLTPGQQRGILLFNLHHIAADGWSVAILTREFVQQYQALLTDQPDCFEPLMIQYGDYALWQRDYLQGEVLRHKLEHWTLQLADMPQLHGLPLDFVRPQVPQHQGSLHCAKLSAQSSKAVGKLAQQQGLTPFMLIHAAFGLLLSRHSNRSDIVIGTPVANRLQQDIAPLIGLFVNTLVLRSNTECSNTDYSDDSDTLADYLEHIKQVNLNAQAHQDVPLELLLAHLDINRSTAYNPLFQIMLSMNTNEQQTLALDDISFTPLASELTGESVTAKFDLQLEVSETEQGYAFNWIYDRALFKEATIARLSRHLLTLLAAMVSDTSLLQAKTSQLPMLSELETDKLLVNYQQNQLDYNRDQLIHSLFEAQVQRTPDAIAVDFPEQPELQMSYTQLNQQANQLAHHLLARGIGRDDLVGISLSRTPMMLVAVLAVLKANGAYVPLDPNYPQSRLQYLLDDSGIKLMLTDQDWSTKLQLGQVLRVDEADSFSGFARTNPAISGTNTGNVQQLAYVIYTSGSTGQPKGVAIEHRNTVAMLHWAKATYSDAQLARVLASTSLNFDLSVFELFVPLCFGHQCVLVKDALTLIEHDVNVTLINTVPSAISALMAHDAIGNEVKVINLAGEPLSAQVVNTLLQSGACESVFNLYGPSEDTTYSTYAEFTQVVPGVPSIGRVIANSQAYVLSEQQTLLPQGSIGELCLAGDGVARGYLNRPELTSEKFIDNPFGPGKLYRTGDLVRYLAVVDDADDDDDDAVPNLDFIGRADEQVKLRGFRIELGEIENQLEQLCEVSSAVVLVKGDLSEQQQLVAYVELVAPSDPPNISLIIEPLKLTLPHYMVPGVVVFIQQWPLTANGKVDKKKLPLPDVNESLEYCGAATETERQLVQIWSELFGLSAEHLSTTANFFALGGHSLMTVRLAGEIRLKMSFELPLKTIFAHNTIATLAAYIDQGNALPLRQAVTRIDRENTRNSNALPLSFAQQRLWFIDQLNGGSRQYNMATAFAVGGDFNIAVATQAMIRIITRHEPLRTTFSEQTSAEQIGSAVQIIRDEFDFQLTFDDLSALDQVEQQAQSAQLIEQHSHQLFDLRQDLMVRMGYIALSDDESGQRGIVLLNMHHIASDGWSMGLLIKAFSEQYQAISGNLPDPHAPLDIRYSDYAHWQREWLDGSVLDKQRDYWQQQLADLPMVHSLVLDHPRPAIEQYVGATVANTISAQLTDQLSELAQGQGITLFMLLHGVLGLVLSRHSNESDVVIGTPVANRLQSELEPLIGFFVNTLVLRTHIGQQNFGDYLKQVRQVNLDAQANQDLPFEQLVELLPINRNSGHNPLFQIMFSMNSNDAETLALPGLRFSPLEDTHTAVKFDLDIDVQLGEQGLTMSWVYDVALFEHSHIEQLHRHFATLLQNIVTMSADELWRSTANKLPMLSPAESQQLVVDYHHNQLDYDASQLIHHLFEAQALRTPDAIALVYPDPEQPEQQPALQLSYQALNEQANQLAHHLLACGIGGGDLVGISLSRTPLMVVAVLAVLKANGAYVPLDPNYPQSRLQYLLDDSGIKLLLTDQDWTGKLQVGQLLRVDEADSFSAFAQTNPVVSGSVNDTGTEEQLAYVIYTSGSTGQPKGVAIEHRNAVAMLHWARATYSDAQLARVLASTSLNFDLSVFELFVPLCFGHQCVLVKDALALMEQDVNVTLINTVPSAISALMAHNAIGSEVKVINLAGEPLSAQVVNGLLQSGACESVFNLYGPSEDTTYSTYAEFTQPVAGVPTIGRVIANSQAYVLSDQQALLPHGSIGELCLAGDGVARGYLNRPELTSEKFIDNPFGPGKLYRTGDMVRYIGNEESTVPNLDFIGRADEQVKLRGFRIELGEIENQLERQSMVGSAVVLIKQDPSGQQHLVAYVELLPSAEQPTPASIIEPLTLTLPHYMVPGALVIIQKWPLTPNGKIDKKALPTPDRSLSPAVFTRAETQTEKMLAQISAELLNMAVDKVSMTANFFELGGHSLLLARLVSTINNHFAITLSMRAVFELKTLKDIALEIDRSLTVKETGQRLEQAEIESEGWL
jgi:amino acid adenylation domain-containing protein